MLTTWSQNFHHATVGLLSCPSYLWRPGSVGSHRIHSWPFLGTIQYHAVPIAVTRVALCWPFSQPFGLWGAQFWPISPAVLFSNLPETQHRGYLFRTWKCLQTLNFVGTYHHPISGQHQFSSSFSYILILSPSYLHGTLLHPLWNHVHMGESENGGPKKTKFHA